MKCPKCQLDRKISDRVCPRCKYLFDEDRFISVTPPRKGVRESRPPAMLGKRIRNNAVYAAALIPGLAHLLSGSRMRGYLFFFSTLALMAAGLLFFHGIFGQILFGVAVSIHAYSIFDLTPFRNSSTWFIRMLVMMSILALLFLAYWPMASWLAERVVPERLVPRGYGPRGLSFGAILLMALAIGGSFFIAHTIQTHRNRRGPR